MIRLDDHVRENSLGYLGSKLVSKELTPNFQETVQNVHYHIKSMSTGLELLQWSSKIRPAMESTKI